MLQGDVTTEAEMVLTLNDVLSFANGANVDSGANLEITTNSCSTCILHQDTVKDVDKSLILQKKWGLNVIYVFSLNI